MEERFVNFSAGPAALPLPVLEQVRDELVCLPGAGASVMEISHRSKQFEAILAAAKENIRRLLQVPETYQILFIQGGASLQFSMLAMNFLDGASADYIETGAWSKKASDEAKKHGTVKTVWSGKSENYIRTPKNEELQLSESAAFVHYCSNETIQGVQFCDEPEVGETPLFCDSSSDFMSRPLPVHKYAMIYGGAQKNVGPSGVAVVIIRNEMLEKVPANLPSLLDYKVIAHNDSMYNTPPTFGIYVIKLVTEWLLDTIGGLDQMHARNREKAHLLYEAIDNSGGFYRGHAMPQCRSMMNVTFVLPSEELEKRFITEATAAGLDGLQGHRSVGGCRASIYNAMPVSGVQALRDFMAEFQQKNG